MAQDVPARRAAVVKTTPTAAGLRIEAWVRYWILPAVSAGEMGIEGVFDSAPKRCCAKRLMALERLLD